MQHELLTDGPPPDAPEENGLMDSRHPDLSRQPVEITWDVPTSELAHQVAALMTQADRLANYVTGLPVRDDHDALLNDVSALQQQVGILFDVQMKQAQAIHDLTMVVQVLHRRERAA